MSNEIKEHVEYKLKYIHAVAGWYIKGNLKIRLWGDNGLDIWQYFVEGEDERLFRGKITKVEDLDFILSKIELI